MARVWSLWLLGAGLGAGLAVLGGGGAGAAPLVTSPWGRLAGLDWSSPSGGRYSAYLAVPFALPPLGARRFQKPQPHPGISTIHNATKFGHSCWQSNPIPGLTDISDMDEDCLTLNVFVPGNQSSKPASGWAVMIWIHGGGYVVGNAKPYYPYPLVVDNNVIVVTLQYRLGAFGFLSTGDALLPGNWGLWDQTLAIQWVKDNIAAFGGDNSTMTLIGESAGSGSVTAQLLSPHTAGLFQRVIGQSGSASAFWSNAKNSLKDTVDLAVRLGCLGSKEEYAGQKEAVVACLREKDAGQILNISASMVTAQWYPRMDGDFFTKEPHQALRDTAYLQSTGFFDRDLMMGVNNNEGVMCLPLVGVDNARNAPYYRLFFTAILQPMFGDFDPSILDVLEYEYTYPRDPRHPNNISLQGFLDTCGDTYFMAAIVDYTRAHARKPAGKSSHTFLYHFDHDPAAAPYGGMAHAQDTVMLFPQPIPEQNASANPLSLATSFDSTDYRVARVFVAFLAEFAKSGDPNPGLTGSLPPASSWTEFDPLDESYLAFADNSSVKKHLNARRVSLLLDVFPRMQQRWKGRQEGQKANGTGCMREPPVHLGQLRLEVGQAEALIIALLAASSLLLLLLFVATICACSQRQRSSAKYQM